MDVVISLRSLSFACFGVPPWGYIDVSLSLSAIWVNFDLQILHSKGVIGQIRLSKGVRGLTVKAPGFGRGFFDSYSIVEDWRKLFCHGDVVYFEWVMGN